MTQPVKQDERVLDYIYGELDEGERTSFEAELAEDAALRAEVESLRGVSREFRGLPKLTQSPDSVQRMTALLMQQAVQTHGQHAGQGGRGETASAAAARAEVEAGVDGRGKVLPMRGRALRRIFTSPASGIFAAAAAALFWVVLKSQGPTSGPLPSAPAKLEPVAMAPPPPPAVTTPQAPAAAPLPVEEPAEKAQPLKEAFVAALNKDRDGTTGEGQEVTGRSNGLAKTETLARLGSGAAPAKPGSAPTTLALAPTDKKGYIKAKGKDDLDSLLDSDRKPGEKKPLVVAMAPRAETKKSEAAADDAPAEPRFAQPPPPLRPTRERAAEPPEPPAASKPTLRQQMAQAGDRRKERIVEELANQELGSMPTGRGGGATPSQQIDNNEGRYAQNQLPAQQAAPAAAPPPPPPAPADEQQRGSAGPAPAEQNYAQNAAPSSGSSANVGPRRVANQSDGDSGGSALAQTLQEQLRQGRCIEAHATLTRLEQAFPATSGLAELRAQWLRTCQATNNQAPTPALQMPQAASPAAPAPAPAPKLAPRTMELEQAYSPSNRSMQMKSPAYRAKKAAPAPSQQQQMQQKARGADKADALY